MKFSNLTIGRRVALGFTLVLILAGSLGGFAVWRMSQAVAGARFLAGAVAPQALVTSNLAQASAEMQKEARSFSFTGDERHLKAVRAGLQEVRSELTAAEQLAKEQPSLTALAEATRDAEKALADYIAAFGETERNLSEIARVREVLDEQAAAFVTSITNYQQNMAKAMHEELAAGTSADKLDERLNKVEGASAILNLGNQIRIRAQKAQALRDVRIIAEALPMFDEMERSRTSLLPITRQTANLNQLAAVAEAATAYRGGANDLARLLNEADAINGRRMTAATNFDQLINGVMVRSIDRTLGYAKDSAAELGAASTGVVVGLVVMVALGVVVAFLIIAGVNRALTHTAENLTQGSLQVASAAGQVSSASQSLAEGSSEQAASLEEISSSIEELTSMTKRNADNAQAGKTASNHARTAAETGAEEMARMQDAMNAIQQSSSDISKIIKTIDEIAFQTNILALNAAVEAARAGEAGAGFAVVADEVRSLAQRSAVAAKETADKIADATQKSAQGVELSTRVSVGLREIVEKAREVDRLVAEVATASHEQSEGLAQINMAVTQMDKVTQSNAAGAEETASAAEQLNAQSAELQQAAAQLAALVGAVGSSGERPAAVAAPARLVKSVKIARVDVAAHSTPRARLAPAGKASAALPDVSPAKSAQLSFKD